MNGGGSSEMGPDLNRPMNPTEYFQRPALHRFIRDPASVRAWPDQKMPGFGPDRLSEAEVEAVIAYLEHMTAQRSH
jgi:mono/diheme cytochrome c family protein